MGPEDAPRSYDVAVIGAGIAGLAACVLLREAGFRVVCIDARPYPHHKVGESLDWSSPGLLTRLGIGRERLLDEHVATRKAKIVVNEIGRPSWMASPPEGIRRAPLRFETVTLHVDRTALDARVLTRAEELGTQFVWERVATVEAEGDRVTACVTGTGRRVEARWFVDASGTARVFSRALDIPITTYGRQKVCLWTYFDTPPLYDGTAFFVDNRERYLSWTWDIPISPSRTSVGFVVPADVLREHRRAGRPLDAIFREELSRYPRFDALLLDPAPLAIEATAFQPYVTSRVCGANWLMAGEAASMPDPLTGNGVTSGIRHARHVAEAIAAARVPGALTGAQRRMYSRHVVRLGHSFNQHIERAIYRHHVRWGLGLRTATYVYTLFAFFTNALHARFDPRGRVGMAAFAVLFAGARAWMAGWILAARAALWWRSALQGER
jgi:flavin-dependent dehydrogenase